MTYTLQPVALRGLLPSLISDLPAVALIFFGLKLNLTYLGVALGKFGSIVLLMAFVAFGLIVLMHSLKVLRMSYIFSYTSVFIQGENKTLRITEPKVEQNFIDRIFKTCTISLGEGKLDFVPNDQRIINYVKQLAAYSQRM
ncbi:MAG: hypothetical protein KJ709_06230 [Nanoarchaeota archaeon]|nr:hypothetical protein [Nanoarchaeota archaeon]